MSAIHLEAASLAIGGRTILHDLSFAIGEGEFVALLGPNGAGKTTLLRALLGLVRPAAGAVRVFGSEARPGGAGIGYLPQARRLPAAVRISGRDFVASAWRGAHWGLPLAGRSGSAAVDQALADVGATALAPRPLDRLSGGERQRLLLAQAILGRPRLLLLDEPLLSLDPRRQEEAVALVRRLSRELGTAVLFSAHEINPLLGAADRVLYLGGGRAALGPVDAVITAPVLSELYGAPIEVLRVAGRIMVLAGGHDVERHGHDHHGHDHDSHDHHGHDPGGAGHDHSWHARGRSGGRGKNSARPRV